MPKVQPRFVSKIIHVDLLARIDTDLEMPLTLLAWGILLSLESSGVVRGHIAGCARLFVTKQDDLPDDFEIARSHLWPKVWVRVHYLKREKVAFDAMTIVSLDKEVDFKGNPCCSPSHVVQASN